MFLFRCFYIPSPFNEKDIVFAFYSNVNLLWGVTACSDLVFKLRWSGY